MDNHDPLVLQDGLPIGDDWLIFSHPYVPRTTRESTIFVCDICGAEFRGRDYWLRHIKEHGKQVTFRLILSFFLSTTEFTILSRTIIFQGWVSDVCMLDVTRLFFVHDGIKFRRGL